MNIGPTDGQGNGLLYVGFNQDQGMAAVISKYLENACITGISVRCGSASRPSSWLNIRYSHIRIFDFFNQNYHYDLVSYENKKETYLQTSEFANIEYIEYANMPICIRCIFAYSLLCLNSHSQHTKSIIISFI